MDFILYGFGAIIIVLSIIFNRLAKKEPEERTKWNLINGLLGLSMIIVMGIIIFTMF